MAELLAIISKTAFDDAGIDAAAGAVWEVDRYASANKALKSLAEPGSRLWLVTVRPGERLWLVGTLVAPVHDGLEWMAPAANALAMRDITALRDRLVFASGKGVAPGALGAALQSPRALAASDIALFEGATAPRASSGSSGSSGSTPSPADIREARAAREAERERDTRAHRIELAKSGRAKCATCEQTLAKGALRLAEVYMHADLREPILRFHHLPCAATAVPFVLRSALAGAAADVMAPDARDALLARATVQIEKVAQDKRDRYAAINNTGGDAVDAAATAASPTSAALIAQVADAPDDAGILAVLADDLAQAGDPRGELISVMLALAAAAERGKATAKLTTIDDDVAELVRRRDALLSASRGLTPRFDAKDRAIWGVGFIRRLELRGKTAQRLDEMASIWRHASLAVVRELRVEFDHKLAGPEAMPGLVAHAPATFTRLELGHDFDHALGDVAAFANRQTRLRHLAISGRCDLGALASATLEHFEIVGNAYIWTGEELAQVLGQVAPALVPAVRSLRLEGTTASGLWVDAAPACGVLADRGWLARTDTLVLAKLALGPDAIASLARGLASRRLARLDVAACRVDHAARAALAKLCTDLAFPAGAIAAATAEATHCEHAAKPEWGRGKIVSRKDGKLEVKFPKKDVGTKVFKADAPFLKLS